jgi:hypothetical protein
MVKSLNKYFVILVVICTCTLHGQTFPVKTILENGPRDKRINLVFLGDGYQASEMNKYLSDVQSTTEKIFLESPYKEYKSLFNVYAIEVPSKESGTDHPGTASDCGSLKDSVFKKDTYFDTSFDASGIHRLLVANGYTKFFEVMKNNFPDYDIVLMVVNHPWYGGSGGSIAVFSANYSSAEVAIHETGHSFARLADEYDYGYPQPGRYNGFNVTDRTSRDSIPWNAWINPATPIPTPISGEFVSTVGLFEGAYYSSKGMYRPKISCKMRDLGVPFCEVCIEQHVRSMFDFIELIEEHTPTANYIELPSNEKRNFSIKQVQLPFGIVASEWLLDNKVILSNSSSFEIDGAALTIGRHNLTALVKHISPLVKNDPYNTLQRTVNWTIDVKTPTDIHNNKSPIEFSLEQNFPNPFNPSTTINYSLPEAGHVTIKVFDVLGREVIELVNEVKSHGKHSVKFDAHNFSSGIYIYTIRANNFSASKAMMLAK